MANPYEYFNSIDDYYKLMELHIKNLFRSLLHKIKTEGVPRTFTIIKEDKKESGKKTLLVLKSDVCFLTYFFG